MSFARLFTTIAAGGGALRHRCTWADTSTTTIPARAYAGGAPAYAGHEHVPGRQQRLAERLRRVPHERQTRSTVRTTLFIAGGYENCNGLATATRPTSFPDAERHARSRTSIDIEDSVQDDLFPAIQAYAERWERPGCLRRRP